MNVIKTGIVAGSWVIGAIGALNLTNGIREKNARSFLKGGLQTAVSTIGTTFFCSSRIMAFVYAVGLTGCIITKLGVHDLVEGRYRSGLCKMLLGIGGITSAAYCVYRVMDLQGSPRECFFMEHEAEIERIYKEKLPLGSWRISGRGWSKEVFEHPDLPETLIKTPRSSEGFRGLTGEDDLRIDYENFQRIRGIATRFDRIVLPETQLYRMSNGDPIIIQQKLNLTEYSSVPDSADKQEAVNQFFDFAKAAKLCDLDLKENVNSGILDNVFPHKIGVVDFDCRRRDLP